MKTEQLEGTLATPPNALQKFHASVSLYAFTPPPSAGPSPASALRRSARTAVRLQHLVKKEEPAEDDDELPRHVLPTPPRSSRKRKASALDADAEDGDFKARGTPSKVPRGKSAKRGYAPPETYAHLRELNDCLAVGLDVVFCGIKKSAEVGHHFAHPTNKFWPCLFHSGFTPRRVPASEDHTLPELFNLGLTDLVERPSAEAGELSREEMAAAVPSLLRKIKRYQPRVICFVGKAMWVIVGRVLQNIAVYPDPETPPSAAERPDEATKPAAKGKGKKKTPKARGTVGLQQLKVVHGPKAEDGAISETLIFVVLSTSGLVRETDADMAAAFATLKGHVDELKLGTLDTSHMGVVTVDSD